MKAMVQDRYGPPEVLSLRTVETPVAGDNELLLAVRASSVNAYDWHLMRGDPYLARLSPLFGLRRPRSGIRGRDVAGQVVAVGRNVTDFRPGDEVFGDLGPRDGGFAEYACIPDDQVVHKPANLTFEQAAAVPIAGCTALIGLRDSAKVRPGQSVLINGASGGVGTFAVQIAKSFGASVTAVCRTRNVDLVRRIGADHVIDYTRQDFTRVPLRYEVVLDLVGNRTLTDLRRVLTPEGTLVLSGGGVSEGGSIVGPLGLFTKRKLLSPFVRHRLVTVTEAPGRQHLAVLRELIEAGKVSPVIDRTYPLSEAAEAIRYVEIEHARAKVVITV